MTDENMSSCIFCESGKRVVNLTESNRQFLLKRTRDGIAWDNFPILKESADTKKIVETLLRGIQQTVNAQILTPMNASISGLNTLMSALEKNPILLKG
jgi:hypothetical protein